MEVCEVDSHGSRRFSTFRAGNGRTFTPFTSTFVKAHRGRRDVQPDGDRERHGTHERSGELPEERSGRTARPAFGVGARYHNCTGSAPLPSASHSREKLEGPARNTPPPVHTHSILPAYSQQAPTHH